MEIAIFRMYRKHQGFNKFMGYSDVHHLTTHTANTYRSQGLKVPLLRTLRHIVTTTIKYNPILSLILLFYHLPLELATPEREHS